MKPDTTARTRIVRRHLLLGAWRACLILAVGLSVYPVSYHATRLAIALSLTAFILGAPLLFRNRTVWVITSLVILFALAVGFLPGRPVKIERLAARYTRSLAAYEGTKYVWGGENRLGIDCSGLIRRPFINATLQEGLVSLNAGLVRDSISIWWHDTSAQALMEEHRGFTKRIGESFSIERLDHEKLRPGDFAVTSDGVHALAYLGTNTWIEAEPGRRVIRRSNQADYEYLAVPVVLLRWRSLQ